MIDISSLLPQISVHYGIDIMDAVDQANTDLRLSHAVQITDIEIIEVELESQPDITIAVIVSAIHSTEGE